MAAMSKASIKHKLLSVKEELEVINLVNVT